MSGLGLDRLLAVCMLAFAVMNSGMAHAAQVPPAAAGDIRSFSSTNAQLQGGVNFDRDNKADIAVYHPAAGNWYVRQSSDGQMMNGGGIQFGWNAALPAPGDYDGDGRTDMAVYYPGAGNWYIRQSSDGQIMNGGGMQFGWNAAMPVAVQYQINRWFGYINDRNIVAAFGDSITAGISGSPSYVPILAGLIGKDLRKFGYPGQESYFGLEKIGDVLAIHPGFVLVFFGACDAIAHDDTADTIANLRAIVTACRNKQTIPVLTTLLPMTGSHALFNEGVDALNPLIRDLANEQNVPLADVHSRFAGHPEYLIADGLHPTQAGAEVIARTYADLFHTGTWALKN